MRRGIALCGGRVELLYHVPYTRLYFGKPRESEVFYITPKYIPGLRGMLLIYDISDYVVSGEQYIKDGISYRLFFPLK